MTGKLGNVKQKIDAIKIELNRDHLIITRIQFSNIHPINSFEMTIYWLIEAELL